MRHRATREKASRRRGIRAAFIVETWLVVGLFVGWLACRRRQEPERGWRPVRPAPRQTAGGGGAPKEAPADDGPSLADADALLPVIEKLRPLHRKLGPPGPADWLAHHEEPGQTFVEYVEGHPTLPRGRRRAIYVQPLGEFTGHQRKIVSLTAEFLGLYFNLPVKTRKDLPLSLVPETARRTHPGWGDKQLLTGYILRNVLRPRLPDDAACYIAFTASDLWPGGGWNYVFGEATIHHRVGVWSIYRFGNPETEFRLCLLRTMKLAGHETGHMFSLLHCIAHECNMCGCNHLAEADAHPLWLCPECVSKVSWATGADPVKRYEKLAEFCERHGLKEEVEFYRKSVEALKAE